MKCPDREAKAGTLPFGWAQELPSRIGDSHTVHTSPPSRRQLRLYSCHGSHCASVSPRCPCRYRRVDADLLIVGAAWTIIITSTIYQQGFSCMNLTRKLHFLADKHSWCNLHRTNLHDNRAYCPRLRSSSAPTGTPSPATPALSSCTAMTVWTVWVPLSSKSKTTTRLAPSCSSPALPSSLHLNCPRSIQKRAALSGASYGLAFTYQFSNAVGPKDVRNIRQYYRTQPGSTKVGRILDIVQLHSGISQRQCQREHQLLSRLPLPSTELDRSDCSSLTPSVEERVFPIRSNGLILGEPSVVRVGWVGWRSLTPDLAWVDSRPSSERFPLVVSPIRAPKEG